MRSLGAPKRLSINRPLRKRGALLLRRRREKALGDKDVEVAVNESVVDLGAVELPLLHPLDRGRHEGLLSPMNVVELVQKGVERILLVGLEELFEVREGEG